MDGHARGGCRRVDAIANTGVWRTFLPGGNPVVKVIGFYAQLRHGDPEGPDLMAAVRRPVENLPRRAVARYLRSCLVLGGLDGIPPGVQADPARWARPTGGEGRA